METSAKTIIRSFDSKELAEDYYRFRPTYAPSVSETILEYMRKIDSKRFDQNTYGKMLDVGCGSGQATNLFGPYFDSILGIDISPGQIHVAKAKNTSYNITYQVVDDNMFPVDDESVDLVNCAATAHFLDMDDFVRECHRVLKPKGCAVIYSVFAVRLATDQSLYSTTNDQESIDIQYKHLVKQFYADSDANPCYGRLPVNLFDEIKNPTKCWLKTPTSEATSTLQQIRGYYGTMGDYYNMAHKTKLKVDPLQVFMDKLKKLLSVEHLKDQEIKLKVSYEYPMFGFRKQ